MEYVRGGEEAKKSLHPPNPHSACSSSLRTDTDDGRSVCLANFYGNEAYGSALERGGRGGSDPVPGSASPTSSVITEIISLWVLSQKSGDPSLLCLDAQNVVPRAVLLRSWFWELQIMMVNKGKGHDLLLLHLFGLCGKSTGIRIAPIWDSSAHYSVSSSVHQGVIICVSGTMKSWQILLLLVASSGVGPSNLSLVALPLVCLVNGKCSFINTFPSHSWHLVVGLWLYKKNTKLWHFHIPCYVVSLLVTYKVTLSCNLSEDT